jgi:hypothetical protein
VGKTPLIPYKEPDLSGPCTGNRKIDLQAEPAGPIIFS